MKRIHDRTRPAAMLAVCVLALLAACGGREIVVLEKGDAAPAFTLAALDGGTTSLADLRGRYVIVRFWADWCKSCRIEMPLIEEKYRAYGRDGLAVLAINVNQSRETAARFAKEVGVSYPILLDRNGDTARAYGVLGLPTTFLLDREGRVMEEIIGDLNRRSLSRLIDPLFAAGRGRSGEKMP